jgi:hypothetical protein
MADNFSIQIRANINKNQSEKEIKQQVKQIEAQLNKTPIQLKIESATGIASQEMSKVAKNYERFWEKSFKNISDKKIQLAKKEADTINNAYNKQLFTNFNKDIGIGGVAKSAKESASVFEDLFNSSKKSTRGLSDLERQVVKLNPQIKSLSSNADHSAQSFLGMVGKFSSWLAVGNIIMGTLHTIKDAINYVVQMDDALVSLSKVVDLTKEQMNDLKNVSIELGKQLGKSSVEIMRGMSEFGRITKDVEEIKELTRVAAMASNVTSLSAQDAAKALTTAMISFNISAKDSMRILDQWNKILFRFIAI